MASDNLVFTRTDSAACPNCRFIVPSLDETAGLYFDHGSITCGRCGSAIDLWTAVLGRLTTAVGWAFSLSALGPRLTYFKFRLPANQGIELDLTKYGIPEGATVLGMNYTPQGGNSSPVETHGNTPQRRWRATRISLYGIQMRTSDGIPIDEPCSGNNIAAMVIWAPAADSEAPWLYLVDALESLALGNLSQAIVPAHSAVEICLTRRVEFLLKRYASNQRIERFLRQELRFSSLLNVILPVVCAFTGAKMMPDMVLQKLNALRKARNKFVHEGVLPPAVDGTEVRRLVCAAAFGFHYGKYLDKFI